MESMPPRPFRQVRHLARLAALAVLPALAGLPGAAAAEDGMSREEIVKRWRAQAGILEAPGDPPPEEETRGLSITPAGSAAASAAGGAAISRSVADGEPEAPAPARAEPERYDRGITVDLRITFEVNSAAIRAEAEPILETLCLAMREMPGETRFNVVGHADASGRADLNAALSEARARAVAERLAGDCGIERDRLVAYGLGETRLLPEVSPVSAANRRVEVSVGKP